MTTPISNQTNHYNVSVDATAARQTPAPSRPFADVVRGGQAVVNGAAAAATRLPGGEFLSAAVRGAGAAAPSSAGVGSPGLGTPGSAGSGMTPEGATSAHGGSAADPGAPAYADQGMQFLELQQRIAAETQAYSALSNVLKARHDTVKGAINNIR